MINFNSFSEIEAHLNQIAENANRLDDLPFSEQARQMGLDPATDFRNSDFSGVDFTDSDLSEFDFRGSILDKQLLHNAILPSYADSIEELGNYVVFNESCDNANETLTGLIDNEDKNQPPKIDKLKSDAVANAISAMAEVIVSENRATKIPTRKYGRIRQIRSESIARARLFDTEALARLIKQIPPSQSSVRAIAARRALNQSMNMIAIDSEENPISLKKQICYRITSPKDDNGYDFIFLSALLSVAELASKLNYSNYEFNSLLRSIGRPIVGEYLLTHDESLNLLDELGYKVNPLFRNIYAQDANQRGFRPFLSFNEPSGSSSEKISLVVRTNNEEETYKLSRNLVGLSTDYIDVQVLATGIGEICLMDVIEAKEIGADIIGLNVGVEEIARDFARKNRIQFRIFDSITEVIEHFSTYIFMLSNEFSPMHFAHLLGVAKVRDIVEVTRKGVIAGGMVIEGAIANHNAVRVIRDNEVIYQGAAEPFDRNHMTEHALFGMSCRIPFKQLNDVRIGDLIEFYDDLPSGKRN